jgi:hypothetical protein
MRLVCGKFDPAPAVFHITRPINLVDTHDEFGYLFSNEASSAISVRPEGVAAASFVYEIPQLASPSNVQASYGPQFRLLPIDHGYICPTKLRLLGIRHSKQK